MFDFDNSLIYLLTQVTNSQKSDLEQALKRCGLHSGQVFVMISLWKADGQRQIDLAKTLHVSPPTIYKMVGSLTAGGFVECRECPADGRASRVYLTEQGRSRQNAVETLWTEFETAFFSKLTETEKLIFSQILAKLM